MYHQCAVFEIEEGVDPGGGVGRVLHLQGLEKHAEHLDEGGGEGRVGGHTAGARALYTGHRV